MKMLNEIIMYFHTRQIDELRFSLKQFLHEINDFYLDILHTNPERSYYDGLMKMEQNSMSLNPKKIDLII